MQWTAYRAPEMAGTEQEAAFNAVLVRLLFGQTGHLGLLLWLGQDLGGVALSEPRCYLADSPQRALDALKAELQTSRPPLGRFDVRSDDKLHLVLGLSNGTATIKKLTGALTIEYDEAVTAPRPS